MDSNLTDEGTPTRVGSANDPDAAVLDSLIESQAEPDKLRPAAHVPRPVETPAMTRLMSGTTTLQAGWGAVLLLPADSRRTGLVLRVSMTAPTDPLRVADDSGKLEALSSSLLLINGDDVTLTHTGPVWVSAVGAVGPVTVTYVATTK